MLNGETGTFLTSFTKGRDYSIYLFIHFHSILTKWLKHIYLAWIKRTEYHDVFENFSDLFFEIWSEITLYSCTLYKFIVTLKYVLSPKHLQHAIYENIVTFAPTQKWPNLHLYINSLNNVHDIYEYFDHNMNDRIA